jgi:outer membrane lipoprotein-sorting protein
MNCREFLKRMPELLDRDPAPAAVDDLMRHTETCPDCAAELNAARNAVSAVTPSLPLTASPGLKERAMKRILTLDSQPAPVRPAPAARKTSRIHVWRYAAAAAVVLAILAITTLKGGGSNAFAQVMEQVRKATSCSYVITTMKNGLAPTRFKTYYKDPGRMRMDVDVEVFGSHGTATSIIDLNQKKLITVIPSTKQCMIFDLTGETAPAQQDAMVDIFQGLRQLPDSGAKPIGTKKIDGIEAVGFQTSQGGNSYVIWADPDDKHVLLVEFDNQNMRGMKGTLSDFNFDAQLDDSLFSLDPPEGYTVINGQSLNLDVPSEETFIRFLRILAEEAEGDLFIPSLDQKGLKSSMLSRKRTAPPLPSAPGPEFMRRNHEITLGLMFAMQMTPENDFHYAGKGVALGNAQQPICWYRPTGARNYRVIYGDLSVREVPPGDLPVPPTN